MAVASTCEHDSIAVSSIVLLIANFDWIWSVVLLEQFVVEKRSLGLANREQRISYPRAIQTVKCLWLFVKVSADKARLAG